MDKIDMRRWIIVMLVTVVALSCDTEKNVEPPEDYYFLKYYGGEGDQQGVDVIANADGTYYLYGTTRAPDKSTQLYLVKVNARGAVMWEKTYGGRYDEEAKDIELTSTGGIVMVANTKTAIGDRNIMIMTLNADGVKIDSSGYSLPGNLDEAANSVSVTNDGFIVAGYTTNVDFKPTGKLSSLPNDRRDALHVRFYKRVSTPYLSSWNNVTGPGTFDEATKIVEVATNSFYLFGSTNSPGLADNNFWSFRLGSGGISNSGDIHPTSTEDETSKQVVVLPSGIAMIGTSVKNAGDTSMYMLKLRNPLGFQSTSGDIEVAQTITLSGTVNLVGSSISPYKSSGYLVLGTQRTGNATGDIFLSSVNLNLRQLWTEPTSLTFGGACEDIAGTVVESMDGRIIMIGTIRTGDECESKMALIKVNKDGKFAK